MHESFAHVFRNSTEISKMINMLQMKQLLSDTFESLTKQRTLQEMKQSNDRRFMIIYCIGFITRGNASSHWFTFWKCYFLSFYMHHRNKLSALRSAPFSWFQKLETKIYSTNSNNRQEQFSDDFESSCQTYWNFVMCF